MHNQLALHTQAISKYEASLQPTDRNSQDALRPSCNESKSKIPYKGDLFVQADHKDAELANDYNNFIGEPSQQNQLLGSPQSSCSAEVSQKSITGLEHQKMKIKQSPESQSTTSRTISQKTLTSNGLSLRPLFQNQFSAQTNAQSAPPEPSNQTIHMVCQSENNISDPAEFISNQLFINQSNTGKGTIDTFAKECDDSFINQCLADHNNLSLRAHKASNECSQSFTQGKQIETANSYMQVYKRVDQVRDKHQKRQAEQKIQQNYSQELSDNSQEIVSQSQQNQLQSFAGQQNQKQIETKICSEKEQLLTEQGLPIRNQDSSSPDNLRKEALKNYSSLQRQREAMKEKNCELNKDSIKYQDEETALNKGPQQAALSPVKRLHSQVLLAEANDGKRSHLVTQKQHSEAEARATQSNSMIIQSHRSKKSQLKASRKQKEKEQNDQFGQSPQDVPLPLDSKLVHSVSQKAASQAYIHIDAIDSKKSGRWTMDEHFRFLEALQRFGKEWKRVQQHVGTRSSTQARSHAQKFFVKLEKKSQTLENFLNSLDLEAVRKRMMEAGNNQDYEDLDAYSPGIQAEGTTNQPVHRKSGSLEPQELPQDYYKNQVNSSSSVDDQQDEIKSDPQTTKFLINPQEVQDPQDYANEMDQDKHSKNDVQQDKIDQKSVPLRCNSNHLPENLTKSPLLQQGNSFAAKKVGNAELATFNCNDLGIDLGMNVKVIRKRNTTNNYLQKEKASYNNMVAPYKRRKQDIKQQFQSQHQKLDSSAMQQDNSNASMQIQHVKQQNYSSALQDCQDEIIDNQDEILEVQQADEIIQSQNQQNQPERTSLLAEATGCMEPKEVIMGGHVPEKIIKQIDLQPNTTNQLTHPLQRSSQSVPTIINQNTGINQGIITDAGSAYKKYVETNNIISLNEPAILTAGQAHMNNQSYLNAVAQNFNQGIMHAAVAAAMGQHMVPQTCRPSSSANNKLVDNGEHPAVLLLPIAPCFDLDNRASQQVRQNELVQGYSGLMQPQHMVPKTPCLKSSVLKSPMMNPANLDGPPRALSHLDLDYLDLEYFGVSGMNADNQSRLSIEEESPPMKQLSNNVDAYHNTNSRQRFGSCVAGVHELLPDPQIVEVEVMDTTPNHDEDADGLAPTGSLARHHRSAQKMGRQFGLSMHASPQRPQPQADDGLKLADSPKPHQDASPSKAGTQRYFQQGSTHIQQPVQSLLFSHLSAANRQEFQLPSSQRWQRDSFDQQGVLEHTPQGYQNMRKQSERIEGSPNGIDRGSQQIPLLFADLAASKRSIQHQANRAHAASSATITGHRCFGELNVSATIANGVGGKIHDNSNLQ